MNLKRIYAVFLRQFYLIRGNPTRLISLFLWLTIEVIQWGFIRKYLSTFNLESFSFVTVILGAIILWEFMNRIQSGVMVSFLEDIWSQNFINYFASPLKTGEYLAGLILTSIGMGVIGLAIMIIIAGLGFGYSVFLIGLMLLPFLVILFIFGIAMGIFFSALIFRLGPTAEWLGWPMLFIISIFSGVFYPVSTLPLLMQTLAKIIPPTYVFESLRAILTTGTYADGLALNLIIGAALSFAALLIAYAYFLRVYRRNLKTGQIARFGAEDV